MSAPLPVEGELTVFTVHALKDRLLAALAGDGLRAGLTVDLSAVSEIDGAGVQLLMAARREAAQRGIAFTLAEPSAVAAEALALIDLAGHFGAAPPSTRAPQEDLA